MSKETRPSLVQHVSQNAGVIVSGVAGSDNPQPETTIPVFDLSKDIHRVIGEMNGETLQRFDLVESQINKHGDIVENIVMYQCVAIRSL